MNEIGKTPGEVSKTLDVTGATLRNYVKNFALFLSPDATRKTRKRFSPEDVDTLLTAKSLLNTGLTYGQVSERLETQPLEGEVIDETSPAGSGSTFEDIPPAEEQTTAIELLDWFENVLERQKEQHQTALDIQTQHIESLKSDKERIQRQLNFERLPWWRKWRTEPPD